MVVGAPWIGSTGLAKTVAVRTMLSMVNIEASLGTVVVNLVQTLEAEGMEHPNAVFDLNIEMPQHPRLVAGGVFQVRNTHTMAALACDENGFDHPNAPTILTEQHVQAFRAEFVTSHCCLGDRRGQERQGDDGKKLFHRALPYASGWTGSSVPVSAA
jgi:hypothetical protein